MSESQFPTPLGRFQTGAIGWQAHQPVGPGLPLTPPAGQPAKLSVGADGQVTIKRRLSPVPPHPKELEYIQRVTELANCVKPVALRHCLGQVLGRRDVWDVICRDYGGYRPADLMHRAGRNAYNNRLAREEERHAFFAAAVLLRLPDLHFDAQTLHCSREPSMAFKSEEIHQAVEHAVARLAIEDRPYGRVLLEAMEWPDPGRMGLLTANMPEVLLERRARRKTVVHLAFSNAAAWWGIDFLRKRPMPGTPAAGRSR